MSELTPSYRFSSTDKRAIIRAINIIEKKYISAEAPPPFISSNTVAKYLRLKFPDHDREHFLVLFLNNQNQLIASEIIFSGNINSVVVHPAVIARKALQHNASAILLAHNHPSGNICASEGDKHVTERVSTALSMLDIKVLDHIIIAPGGDYFSFTEHGLL